MATVANAEVLPIAITANDNSASAWQSFKRNANDAKGAVDQLKSALGGLEQGSTSGISGLANLAKYAKNPYVLLALAIAGVGIAGQKAADDLAKIGDAADSVGVKASVIAGLGLELKKVGGDAGDAIAGLKNLRTQLDLQSRDGGYLENLFKLNGSSINDAAGRVKSVEQVYGELSRMIQGAANETERLEIATNAFGSEAAPKMVKAILAGTTSLEKLGQANIDPLIQQSRELALIWDGISKGGDGWFAKLKNRLAEGWGALEIGAAALAGSQRAQESLYLMNNPNAQRSISQNDTDAFYNAVRGRAGATVTPSNRKADPLAANEYDRAINSVTKHIALMQADAAAVGKTAGEHERLRVEAELLAAAQRKGGAVTEEQRKQFDALAESAKRAADQLAFAKLQNDLMFERSQLGRSEVEQTVASRLRGAGVDANSDQGQFLAQQIRINESLKYTQDIAKDALKGFIADLRAGKSAGEAFANVLNRIADKLLDTGINSAINALTGGFFGNGTGGVAGTMSVGAQSFPSFGFHSGGIVGAEPTFMRRAANFNGTEPRYHDGLMPNEFKAILKRGEGVFTEGQMAALGDKSGGRVSIGDIYVTVPEGTSAASAGDVAEHVKAALIQVVDERLSYHQQPRGRLNAA